MLFTRVHLWLPYRVSNIAVLASRAHSRDAALLRLLLANYRQPDSLCMT